MADSTISGLSTALLYSGVASGDYFVIDDTDAAETKKITAENLALYVLENKTIGGSASGDIPTNTSTAATNNKALGDNITLNSGAALTVTSDELNLLDGLTADYSELNILDGATVTVDELNTLDGIGTSSTVGSRLTSLEGATTGTARIYSYTTEWSANASATKTITEATINTACSIQSGYYVNHASLRVSLYSKSTDTYTMLPWGATYGLTFDRTDIGGGVYGLDDLTISGLDTGGTVSYCVNLTFSAVASGV